MKKENHMPRDSNSLLRKQIRTAAKIFEWIDHITESENDAVQDIFFEDDKPLMCLYCGMKRKSFRIYTEINTANDSISVSISFPVSCNDENMPRVTTSPIHGRKIIPMQPIRESNSHRKTTITGENRIFGYGTATTCGCALSPSGMRCQPSCSKRKKSTR